MKKLEILKIVAPKKNKGPSFLSHYALFKVTVRDPETESTWDIYQNRDNYQAFLIEQELLTQGIAAETLDTYRALLFGIATSEYDCPECGNGPSM